MEVIQVTIDLSDPSVTASLDPDPSGALVRAAKARGLVGEDLTPLTENTLSGGLRLTLTSERALALAQELALSPLSEK